MEPNLTQIINMLEKEKNISREAVVDAIETAILTASKKKYGNEENIEVEVNTQSGEIEAYLYRVVVDEVEDPSQQISLTEARGYDETIEVGDEFAIRLDVAELGRIAAQTAKQVLVQRVREAEREVILEEFGGRIGETINGIVMRMERGVLVVDLGKAEGILPQSSKIPGERFNRGDRVRALIQDVQDTAKSPQVVLTRNAPEFLAKLFEMEVPEIYEGVVQILKVVREPGQRAKIAVVSKDSNVDPVGACVGMKGSRVQAVVQELCGEKIDIIAHTDVARDFIEKALSPAAISRIAVNEEDKTALVVVEENQLSLAIGRKGQNVRLASALTGYQINLMTEEDYQTALREQQEEAEAEREAIRQGLREISRIPGIGEKTAKAMVDAGFLTAAAVAGATLEELTAVPGVGPKTAEKFIEAAGPVAEEVAKEAEEAAKIAEAEAAAAAEAAAQAEAEAEEAARAEAEQEKAEAETSEETAEAAPDETPVERTDAEQSEETAEADEKAVLTEEESAS